MLEEYHRLTVLSLCLRLLFKVWLMAYSWLVALSWQLGGCLEVVTLSYCVLCEQRELLKTVSSVDKGSC